MSYSVSFDGLPELARHLKEIQPKVLEELKAELKVVGEVVRVESYRRFTAAGDGRSTFTKTAENFETRVRAGGSAKEVVVVGQRRRKTTGRRPDWGAKQMTDAFLPARDAKMKEAERLLQAGAVRLLRGHGFV